MHEAETRALRRAVALLLVISVLRWGWSTRADPPPLDGNTVLPELLGASRDAADEGERRSKPLAEGEHIDVNRADEAELDRLPGIGPSTARAISAARERGMVFRRPDDLLAVPGVGPATLARIRPDLSLRDPPSRRVPSAADAPELVDVNRADLQQLQSLPGIGPAIAERVLVAREEQMFASLDDLARVRGIGAATVERLRPYATVGPEPRRRR